MLENITRYREMGDDELVKSEDWYYSQMKQEDESARYKNECATKMHRCRYEMAKRGLCTLRGQRIILTK